LKVNCSVDGVLSSSGTDVDERFFLESVDLEKKDHLLASGFVAVFGAYSFLLLSLSALRKLSLWTASIGELLATDTLSSADRCKNEFLLAAAPASSGCPAPPL
jgi:hypothetical protein